MTLGDDLDFANECLHESTDQYDEFQDESTGEVISEDFEVCKDCGSILMNGEFVCDKNGKTPITVETNGCVEK